MLNGWRCSLCVFVFSNSDLRADKLPLVYDRASSYRTLSFSYAALDIAHYNVWVVT